MHFIILVSIFNFSISKSTSITPQPNFVIEQKNGVAQQDLSSELPQLSESQKVQSLRMRKPRIIASYEKKNLKRIIGTIFGAVLGILTSILIGMIIFDVTLGMTCYAGSGFISSILGLTWHAGTGEQLIFPFYLLFTR